MYRRLTCSLSILASLVLLPAASAAQQPTTVTGVVTTTEGEPLPAASVQIADLNLGSLTNNQGRYLILVPASRVTGQEVVVTASLIGRAAATQRATLAPGTVTLDFQLGADPLRLEEIVVTGAGTTQERQKLGVSINTVSADEIVESQEGNIVQALAGKAPNVEVTSSAGDPGAGSYIRIRGVNSLLGDGQPLIVVDGVPIDNSSNTIESNAGGTVEQNRAADLNPQDIADIQILKGASAAAIYGSRAANGVVLITTKKGRPGTNQVQYKVSYSFDEVTETVPVQTSFGQGMSDLPFGGTTNDACQDVYGLPQRQCPVSWGGEIPAGTPVFNHADEVYQTGNRLENFLSLSGGSETTNYYLSLGRLDHDGVIRGNSSYERTTVRLSGSHLFREDLRVGANFQYSDASGDLIQQGSNISGIQLAALRTPPDFDNLPYLTDDGLHRSYRLPDPNTVAQSRGYDNPFWVANEITNSTEVGRTFGNIQVEYTPTDWLSVNYTLGADYANDERLTVFPKSSSDFPDGRLIRADLLNFQVDHNLVATARRTFNDDFAASLAVGQNLNHREFKRYQVNGQNLILGTDQLDFTVDRIPNEFYSRIRTDGYFAQGTVDLWGQLFLTAALRVDGSSTFGGDGERFAYPKFSGAWDFTQYLGGGEGVVSFAKLRAAYGVAGKQPDPYSNATGFTTGTITDGWLTPNGLETIYSGLEGVVSQATLGNANIDPERTEEFEVGGDLALLDNRVSLALTYYRQNTTDAILAVDVPPSTGFTSKFENAGEFENWGWEATLGLDVYQGDAIDWNVDFQWATNESCVQSLAGAETFGLAGFTGAVASVVAPERDANGNITQCYPFGVFYGDDFIRFGRGSTVNGVAIDDSFSGWSAGDLYIGADGFPLSDPQTRVIGDPNPDWTASISSSVTIYDNLRLSGLLDFKIGGDVWNGTKGALYFFGTHEDTEPYHGNGQAEVFGETYYPNEGVAGPGAGQEVQLNWLTWFWNGIGSSFTGPSIQSIEDGGFVKLRELGLSYTFRDQDWLERSGLSSLALSVYGRNLITWSDYSGVDPETNLWGQSLGRGIDYFNNPQTRSLVINLTATR
ncbi:MAG: SusC/RagA family TonB-linked outer membrane protein [Gemmatimonadota bacterium]